MCDQHRFIFEFDKAFNHQLIEKFEASPEHPLVPDVAPALMGVYALYHRGELVYAGKAHRRAIQTPTREAGSRSDSIRCAASSRWSRAGSAQPSLAPVAHRSLFSAGGLLVSFAHTGEGLRTPRGLPLRAGLGRL